MPEEGQGTDGLGSQDFGLRRLRRMFKGQRTQTIGLTFSTFSIGLR